MTVPHVLVTGSTRGIGAAIVEALSAKGARVVGHGRTDGAVRRWVLWVFFFLELYTSAPGFVCQREAWEIRAEAI